MHNEVVELIDKLNQEENLENTGKKEDQDQKDEMAWRNAVAHEVMEQDRLQVLTLLENLRYLSVFP